MPRCSDNYMNFHPQLDQILVATETYTLDIRNDAAYKKKQ